MLLYDLIDIKNLTDFKFDIEIKPGLVFRSFQPDEEGLEKEYTIIELSDGHKTLIQSLKNSPHLADVKIPNHDIIKAIFKNNG